LNNPKPIYPPLSRAREEEGTVFFTRIGERNRIGDQRGSNEKMWFF